MVVPGDDALAERSVAEVLREALHGRRFGARIDVLERTGSTNDVARELAREGAPDGAIVVASEQFSGRGRRGRTWESPPGLGLYVSVLLRPAGDRVAYATAIQLAAGIAVAEAVADRLPQAPELVWPNDCYCGGRKLAGILVEGEGKGSTIDVLVCGIGVNVNQRPEDFEGELAGRATSLRILSGTGHDRVEVAAALLRRLDQWNERALAGGLPEVIDRWTELSPSARGAWLEVRCGDREVRGHADGLDATGRLRIDTGTAVCRIDLGEVVQVGPPRA